MRPIVFIGLVSYSWYLWHWPIFAFSKYWELAPPTVAYELSLVALGFALAVLSWRFVETPFRQRRWCPTRQSILSFAAAGLATLLIIGMTISGLKGFPHRFPSEVENYYHAAKGDVAFRNELVTRDVVEGNLVVFGKTTSDTPVQMLVWGDSHAMAALPAFDALFRERGLAGRAATHSSTAPLFCFFANGGSTGLNIEAPRFNDAVFAYIEKHRVPEVVLVAAWKNYRQGIFGPCDADVLPPPAFDGLNASEIALLETVDRLVRVGSRPSVLLDVPTYSVDVARGLARAAILHDDVTPLLKSPQPARGIFKDDDRDLIDRIIRLGGRVIDPKPGFLDAAHQHYLLSTGGFSVYSDAEHLTTKGSKLVLLPVLRAAFGGEH